MPCASCSAKKPISAAEAAALFAALAPNSALVLAVSGGPDSTALLWLAARWRDGSKRAAEADRRHGRSRLAQGIGARGARGEEARAQARRSRTARCAGPAGKPKTGIQEAARKARYRLLGAAAQNAGADHILTAHTQDDQAETVLFRLMRGSGVTRACAAWRRVAAADS